MCSILVGCRSVCCMLLPSYRQFVSTVLKSILSSWGWINDERMAMHFLELRCIRLYLPQTLRFHVGFALWKSPGPLEISWASGNLSVVVNAQPNTSHFSAGYIFILDTPNMWALTWQGEATAEKNIFSGRWVSKIGHFAGSQKRKLLITADSALGWYFNGTQTSQMCSASATSLASSQTRAKHSVL